MDIKVVILLSIILTYIALIYFEIQKRKKIRYLKRLFKKKNIQAFDEENFFKQLIREYSNRTLPSGILRWELLSKKHTLGYFILVSIGYLSGFSLFFPTMLGGYGLVILPLSIILFLIFLVVSKRKIKRFLAIVDYFAVSLMVMVIMMGIIISLLYLIEDPDLQIFYIYETNISWFLALSQISFTFAVALFIVVSITTLVKEAESGINHIRKLIEQEIISKKIKSLSDLYKTRIFKDVFEAYGRVSLIVSHTRLIFYLIISFVTLGFVIMAQLASESPIGDGIISTDQLLLVLGVLILLTLSVIRDIYNSSMKLEKNIRKLYE